MYSIVPPLDVPELPLGIRPASARGRENNNELQNFVLIRMRREIREITEILIIKEQERERETTESKSKSKSNR